jgi:hypothetical protein
MGGACSMHGGDTTCIQNCSWKVRKEESTQMT